MIQLSYYFCLITPMNFFFSSFLYIFSSNQLNGLGEGLIILQTFTMKNKIQFVELSSRSNRNYQDSNELTLLHKNVLGKILEDETTQLDNNNRERCYISFLTKLGLICSPFALLCSWPCFQNPVVQQNTGTIGLLEQFGKYIENVEPGIKIVNPVTQKVRTVNLKTLSMTIKQNLMTRDNVFIEVQLLVFYRIVDSKKFAYRLGLQTNFTLQCISNISQASLRAVGGKMELQKIIQKRQVLAKDIISEVQNQVKYWGILVENCCIKQIKLDTETQNIFGSLAASRRKCESLLISAKGDVQSSKILQQAAYILENNSAMQVRYLETIQSIISSSNSNQKIIFLQTKLD